mgnify:CR=1 FL=1
MVGQKFVLGFPRSSSQRLVTNGLRYSTVQMPRGIPVATVAIDGSVNAALLVVEMLAITDTGLQAKLLEDRARRANP